jgi:cytosine deaminase
VCQADAAVLIDRIEHAVTVGTVDTRSLGIRDGHVTEASDVRAAGDRVLDARGLAVLPGFVDAHAHLDKAYLLADAEALGPLAPDVASAIAIVARLRHRMSAHEVRARAHRAIDTMVRHGTIAARIHVELDPDDTDTPIALHLQLAEEVAGRCELQLVAFPQHGLGTAAARRALAAGMDAGLTVVGGCPYVDDDPMAHLDEVFALADRHGAPLDLHLDFDDDPSGSLIPAVVERTKALGMTGQITIGHATTLAALAPDDQAAMLDLLASVDAGLVVLPFSDLHLAGHGDPGTRSIGPVGRALDAGVRVAIGTNNLANPFAPSGNGSLLHAAWLVSVLQRGSGAALRSRMVQAITSIPAGMLGLEPHGAAVGDAAHLVVVDSSTPDMVVADASAVLVTLRRGRVVAQRRAPVLEASADDPFRRAEAAR